MPFRFFALILAVLLCFAAPASAATYTPNGDLIGHVTHYTVKAKDNLYDIARRHDLGIVELLSANPGVDVWQPEPGTVLTLTTQHVLPPVHEGIVLNLPELRLFYFAPNGKVMTFPIGIGREGWQTPLGETKIMLKRVHPAWIPPDSIREEEPNLPDIVPPGPDNPLGQYAMNLGFSGIRIHGTNRPYGIGKRSSHGCIRLYPEDIKLLFNAVDVGTKVTILDMPYRLGWSGDTLWLEVDPTQAQDDVIAAYRQPKPVSLPEVDDAVRRTSGDAEVDWDAVQNALQARDGVPAAVARK